MVTTSYDEKKQVCKILINYRDKIQGATKAILCRFRCSSDSRGKRFKLKHGKSVFKGTEREDCQDL